jgi:uncharacterized protein
MARAQLDEFRMDGWANLFQGYGVRGRDPSRHDRIAPPVDFDRTDLEWMYRGDAIAARCVDLLPDEATRQGFRLKVDKITASEDVDPEKANEIADGVNEYMRRLQARRRIRQGLIYGRLFGAGIGVVGVDDGGSGSLEHFKRPVDEAKIKSVRWIQVFDRWAVTPGEPDEDTSSENFGEPKSWHIHGAGPRLEGFEVHASRVVRFRGPFTPRILGGTSEWWDDSVLVRLWDPIRMFEMAYMSTARTVRDFSRAIYAIKHLHRHIAGNREDVVRRRLEIAEMSMSALNALLLDPDGEKFEFMQRPTTGLPELLDRLGIYLATCSGTPITKLLGVSPGGLGTGDDEDRRFSNDVKAFQEDFVRDPVERVTKYILLAADGPTKGKVPEKYSATFNPLKQPSEKEIAEMRKLVAEAMATLVNSSVLLPDEVAESMFGRGEWSMDITLDRDAREEQKKAEEAGREAELKAMNGEPPAPGDEALMQQRSRERVLRAADGIERTLERVHDERLSPEMGARFLNSVYGIPIEEAEQLTGADKAA